ncbi:MAG: hypothetical protein JNL01_01210 [Bdellovibrionales bacterium]|nr:hypothetical protein [Bdellovibrionales bacterium]
MIRHEDFQQISRELFKGLDTNLILTLNLTAEETDFSRWNDSRVRQTGTVSDRSLSLSLMQVEKEAGALRLRRSEKVVSLSGDFQQDINDLKANLSDLSKEVSELPVDPFLTVPENFGSSRKVFNGKLPEDTGAALGKIFASSPNAPLTGIFSSGRMIRANSSSLGQDHWFETDLSHFDFSLVKSDPQGQARAVKLDWAGGIFDPLAVQAEIHEAAQKMDLMMRPKKKIRPGAYRTYLTAASVAEITGMIAGIFGESAVRKMGSPARLLRSGEALLSEKVTIHEDLSMGSVPVFNFAGEKGHDLTTVVRSGRFSESLVSRSSATEFGILSNAAAESEAIRAVRLEGGSLFEKDAIAKLGEGLYLSNLHYLNYSDFSAGRLTGMTRYACFWVENGKLSAPIEDLRWDDSIFRFLGSELEDLTREVRFLPNGSTYEFRQLGGAHVPGALLKSFQYVL